jgi:hypothetical protein
MNDENQEKKIATMVSNHVSVIVTSSHIFIPAVPVRMNR